MFAVNFKSHPKHPGRSVSAHQRNATKKNVIQYSDYQQKYITNLKRSGADVLGTIKLEKLYQKVANTFIEEAKCLKS